MSKKPISRREFLSLAARMGVAGSIAARLYEQRAWSSPVEVRESLTPLVDCGLLQGPVYEGEFLEHIAFPLGGIGTGSIALSGSAELIEWQIWNKVHKPARVGQTFFALSGKSDDTSFQRVLQTKACSELPDLAPMKSLRFRGEFPIAYVEFEDDLPVEVSLEALSPMIPLQPENSAYPLALFTWKLKNRSDQPVEGRLIASLQNAVGHDGFAAVRGHRFSGYGKNRVKVSKGRKSTQLFFDAALGRAGRFDKSVIAATNLREIQRVLVATERAKVHYQGGWERGAILLSESVLKDGVDVIWHGPLGPQGFSEPSQLLAIARAVEGGTHLVLTGGPNSLARTLLDPPLAENNSVLIADFEGDQYAPGWRTEGEAFGDGPVKGPLPGQSPVGGYLGLGLVNSYRGTDVTVGKLISPDFTLSKTYLQFLIGGGDSADTQIRLVVGDHVVHKASGFNTETLRRKVWDVSEFLNQTARLEIVDENKGGWGHINVDDIRLSDRKDVAFTPEEAEVIRRLLPFSAKAFSENSETWNGERKHDFFRAVSPNVFAGARPTGIEGLTLKEGAEPIGAGKDGAPLAILGTCGKGKVLFLNFDLESMHPGQLTPLLGGVTAFLAGRRYSARTGWPADSPHAGSMALAALAPEVETLPAWRAVSEIDSFLRGEEVKGKAASSPSPMGESFAGALRVPYSLEPGEETTASFAIAWHFPNHYLSAFHEPAEILGNRYNTLFRDAGDVARSFVRKRDEVEGLTRLFHDTFYRSTLPVELLDCVSSQFSILKSQTSLWLADGTFAGWEGVVGEGGCCPMNCTHVYNYAQAMACLYPSLERDVRSKDLGIQLTEEGLIHHRLALPLSAERTSGEALDGQLGTLLKLYREYRRCSNDKFLREWWGSAKRALQFVWKSHDPEGKGVIRDRQFNTYDDAVYELNSFIGSLYLAALRAMEEMALRMGDSATAEECRKRFELGSESVAAECWDGEYFMQPADLETIEGRNYGKGCLSDQVVGQWWAHILRLGHILPSEKVRVALESILKYNWMERMGDFKQNPRVYAGPEDSGLLCCTWPKGGRPKVPILYCDEAWTGIEYQVAGHLIFEGMAERGAEIVRKARRRSNGKLRSGTHPSGVGNPWNEIECGDHYARAMSSYALLLAAQGQDYEGPAGRIAFHPAIGGESHRSFFSAAEGWGSFEQTREGTLQREAVCVAWGRVEARELLFTLPAEARELTDSRLLLSGNAIPCAVVLESNVARFAPSKPLTLAAGDRLLVEMAWRA